MEQKGLTCIEYATQSLSIRKDEDEANQLLCSQSRKRGHTGEQADQKDLRAPPTIEVRIFNTEWNKNCTIFTIKRCLYSTSNYPKTFDSDLKIHIWFVLWIMGNLSKVWSVPQTDSLEVHRKVDHPHPIKSLSVVRSVQYVCI